MKHPTTLIAPIFHNSFFYTLALIAGIALQPFPEILLAAILCTAIILANFLWAKTKPLQLFILFCLCSFWLGATSHYLTVKRLSLTETLSLNGMSMRVREKKITGNGSWPLRITLELDDSTKFFMYTKKTSSIEIDDIVLCPDLKLKPIPPSDFRLYLFKEGVSGTAFVFNFSPILLKRSKCSYSRWLYQKQETLLLGLKKKMSRRSFAFFSSLFIGDRHRVKHAINGEKKFFERWGILHHLARSGLHLMLFIMIWHLLLSILPLPFLFKTFCIVLLSSLYFILTPWSVSFARGFELFLFYRLCTIFEWQIHSIHLLCIVAYLTLVYNPLHLFFLDFQLSFFCTFCLAWLAQLRRQKRYLSYKLLK